MWVVTGPFDGKESDELQPASSKLLKAGKTYTIGRKDQSLVIRHKKISREHARIGVDLCSEQDVANPKSAPPLWIEIIRSDKKKEVARHLIRVGQELPISLNAGERFQLQDGDSIEMVTGVPISLKWQQVCCYWSPKDDPSISLQTCASLGIHVVPTLRHEVTHHLASALTLSPELATSMISVAVIVKPEWLAEVIRLGESADDAPSQLEREFKPPHVSKYRPTFSPFLPSPVKSTSRWEPNEARVGLFRGYRFMFVGEKGRETQDAMKELVKRAEGDYECVAVEGGRSAWHKALAKGKSKGKALVLVADEGSMKIAIGQDRWQEFVDEAKSFELRFVNRAKVIEAVIHIDIQFIDSSLKGGDADTQSGSPLPDVVQNTHPDEPSIPPQTQEPTPALASEAPPPRRPLVRRLPSRAPSRAPSLPPDTASATTVEGAQPQDPDAPKPRRQLVRRLVKPKTTIIGVDDPSVELDGEPALQPSTSSTVQKEDAPQVSNNDAPEPSRAPRRLLKRRLGPNGPLASQVPPPSEDTLAAEPEEPPLKKFKALFEESDPARVAQSGMQSGISTGQTADAGESITQSESGTTQVHPRLRAGGRTQLAALAEEEEESMSGATPDLNVLQPNQSQGLKRKTPMEEDEDVEMVDEEGPRPKRRAVEDVNAVQSSAFGAVGKPPSQATAKPSSRADQTQKSQKPSGAAPGKPDMDEAFLKAVATTKRGKRAEDTFDREFNNLRISKPDLDRDEQQKEWAVLDDFGDDGDMRGNFMVIVEMDVHRKDGEQRALRAGGGRTDWEGRPDFKKFKKARLLQPSPPQVLT